MLIRTLQKIIKNSITTAPNPNNSAVFSPKIFIRSPVERKKTEVNNTNNNNRSTISKFPEDNARKRLVNEKLLKQVEEKNKLIEVMENDKNVILEELKQFYVEIIEMLKLDHSFNEEFKKLLLSSDLMQHLEEYDEHMILNNIKDLLKICLDLRWKVQYLERKDFREEEKDYVIMYRRLEIELKKSLYNEDQLKFMNEVLNSKIEEFIVHQKNLIEKTQAHLTEAKDEYLKVMDLVNNKEWEIEQLAHNNDNQKNVIQSLEERLLSIVVLEYKIKNLDSEHKKKLEKVKNECDRKLENFKISNKYLIKGPVEEVKKILETKKRENKTSEIKIRRLEKEKEKIRGKLTNAMESNNKEIKEKMREIECLKGNFNVFQRKPIIRKVNKDKDILAKSVENNYYISTKPSDQNNSQNIMNNNNQILSTKQSDSNQKSLNYGLEANRLSTKKNNFFYTNPEVFD